MNQYRKIARRWGLLALVVLAGGALRFWDLNGVPPGLWFDEALNAQDAWATAFGAGPRLVYPDEFPREPMLVWLLAAPVRLFGREIAPLRAVPAAIGLATVLALYWALRAWTGERTALLAAAVLALMKWHLIFSRLLFRTVTLPLWMCLIVGTAGRMRRAPTAGKALAFGALLGGGFYTYLAWYFLLPGAAALAVWTFWGFGRDRALRQYAAICLAATLATAAPLGLHYARQPEHLLSRPGAVSPFREGAAAGAREIGGNLLTAAGMFHMRGDHVPKQNIPGAPALDPITGVFFAAGAVLCLVGLARRREAWATMLLFWLALGILPTVFTATDSPNFLRTLAAAPAAAGIAAVGLNGLWSWAETRNPGARGRLRAALLIGVLLLGAGAWNARDVFARWANRNDVWASFNGRETQAALAARRHAGEGSVWIPQYLFEHRTARFLLGDAERARGYANFDFLRGPPAVGAPFPRKVVATAHNNLFPVLREAVPAGKMIEPLEAPEGETWAAIYEIPAGALPPPETVNRLETRHPVDVRW